LASDPWTARVPVADRFATRRVFLVGESAHVNPPYGGHGYNTSIGDAVNIAWKLAFVLHGWAPPALAGKLRGRAARGGGGARGRRGAQQARAARRPGRGRGGDPAPEGAGVPQPWAGTRLLLRRVAGGAAGRRGSGRRRGPVHAVRRARRAA